MDKYVRVIHPRSPPAKEVVPFSCACFEAAAQCLWASTRDVRVLVQTVLSQFASFQEVDELGNERLLPSSWGFKVLLSYVSHWQANEIYTDGSFYEEAKRCGSAVIFPDGTYLQFCPPGQQGIYKAEMSALLLAAEFAAPKSVIRVDNKGVISAVQGHKERVVLRRWFNRIRELVQSKELTLKYVRAHQGEVGNELADQATRLNRF